MGANPGARALNAELLRPIYIALRFAKRQANQIRTYNSTLAMVLVCTSTRL